MHAQLLRLFVTPMHAQLLRLFVTLSGASATPEREEQTTHGPTSTLLHQSERQRDQQLPCFSPHRGPQPPATLASPCQEVGTTTEHRP